MRWCGTGGTSGGGRRAYAYGGTAREGLFLSAKKAEAGDSIIKSHVVVDRTRGHPLETFDAPSSPRFTSPLQPKTTFPKISEDAVGAPWRGWRAPRRGTVKRGCTGASITFITTHTTTRTDRSALSVRLRALFVPSDRNRSPRGEFARLLSWQERLGRGGGGAPAVGRDP